MTARDIDKYPTDPQAKRVGDHLLRAWLVNSHVATFEVIAVLGTETATGDVIYARRNSVTPMDNPTKDPAEASRIAWGDVKWDGCTNLIVEEDEDTMVHTCGLEDFKELLETVAEARRFAASLLDAEAAKLGNQWPITTEYEQEPPK